jgi:P27 family predicted phage terminase small subunit
VPHAPDFLTDDALAEWKRLAPEPHVLGLLRSADVNCFAAYCMAFARWRAAELVLREMAKRDPTTHGLLIRTVEGNPRRNPVAKIAADSASDMVRFAGEFGMTLVARSRIAAGVGPQLPDKCRWRSRPQHHDPTWADG